VAGETRPIDSAGWVNLGPEKKVVAMESRKRVLVVEDDPEVLFVWATALKKMSEVEVETAEDGREALDQFEAEPFDLVVTDLSMPEMSGVELTREIRRLDPNVPVIWVTAHAHYRDRLEEPDLNVHTFLVKPVSIQQIRQVVRDALDHKNTESAMH